MKQKLLKSIKDYLRTAMLQGRADMGISQEEMAHRLLMSSRAYANLENGRSCCSLITMLLFLTRCCADRRAVIEGLLLILDADELENSPNF